MAKRNSPLGKLTAAAEAADREHKSSQTAAATAQDRLKKARQAFKKAKKAHRKAEKAAKRSEKAAREARKALEKAQARAKKRESDDADSRKAARKAARQAAIETPAPRKSRLQVAPRRRSRTRAMRPVDEPQFTQASDSSDDDSFEMSERDLT